MAEKRMFSMKVVDSDEFLELTASARKSTSTPSAKTAKSTATS